MDRERLDLSALDPSADPEQWERLIGAITRRAAPELARRAVTHSPALLLVSWARPMLATAAAIATISAAALAMKARSPGQEVTIARGVIEALEIPAPAAEWLDEGRAPTVDDLILVLEGGSR